MEKRLEVIRDDECENALPSDIARGWRADGSPLQELGDASEWVHEYILFVNSQCVELGLDCLDGVAQVFV